jgi:hypothetical protein
MRRSSASVIPRGTGAPTICMPRWFSPHSEKVKVEKGGLPGLVRMARFVGGWTRVGERGRFFTFDAMDRWIDG